MIIDKIESVEKPLTVSCFHHYCGDRYIGAVWLDTPDLGGKWRAYHACHHERMGLLGEFDSRVEATAALEKSIADLNRDGKYAKES